MRAESDSRPRSLSSPSQTGSAGGAEAASTSTSAREVQGSAPSWYCALDLASAFNSLEIADDGSREVTAFVTLDSKYEYCRLPFGLACAPGYLMQLVQDILSGLLHSACTAYMDDILIWAHSFEECLEHLKLVCERLASSGVSLSAEKCILMAREVTFLGFKLSGRDVGIDPKKIAATGGVRRV